MYNKNAGSERLDDNKLESQYGDEDIVMNLDIDYAVNNLHSFKMLVKKINHSKSNAEVKEDEYHYELDNAKKDKPMSETISNRGSSKSNSITPPRKFSISRGPNPMIRGYGTLWPLAKVLFMHCTNQYHIGN